jgi:hypothetical protein
VIRLGPWPLALAFLSLFLIHERQAPPSDGPPSPRTEAASALAAPFPAPSPAAAGSLESPPDRPLPVLALSDDRADVDENGHPPDDKDCRSFLPFGLCGARAGFDRTTRLPLSPAQAKWFHRAWGQP